MFEKLYSHVLRSLIVAGSGLMVSVTASAQFSTDNSAPIDAGADSIFYEEGLIRLAGQVDVRQGEVRILSDRMDIYTGRQNNTDLDAQDFDKVVASGNFYYLTPEQEVRGENGVYEAKTETFTVTGNVILLQGEDNVITGDRLIYNLSNNEARIVGTCKGRRCGRKGRVNILIKNSGTQTRG